MGAAGVPRCCRCARHRRAAAYSPPNTVAFACLAFSPLQVRQRMSQYEDQLRPMTQEEAAAEVAARHGSKKRRKGSRPASPS